MPRPYTSWRCNKCNKRFSSFKAAEDCEFGHITETVISEFRSALAEIAAPNHSQETSHG